METYYTTAQELQIANGRGCNAGGSKTLNGSFAGLGPANSSGTLPLGVINAGGVRASSEGAFTLEGVKDGPIDLFALSFAAGYSDAYFPPLKTIIRRNQLLSSGATIPVLDFSTPEAVPVASNQLTVIGGLSSDVNTTYTNVTSATGSTMFWRENSDYSGPTVTIHGIPASLVADGDLHQLTFVGRSNGFNSDRSAYLYYKQPSDKTITLGANLNQPTFSTVATSPYLQIRGMLPGQADYGGAVRFYYYQDKPNGDTRSWQVVGTVGYFGGTTPATWQVDMPDLSALPGFDASDGFEADQSTVADVEAMSDLLPLFFGRLPHDGDFVKLASLAPPTIPAK
jgi:hypothetical protein